MRKLKVRLRTESYEIYIGWGILQQVGYFLKRNKFADKAVIITSPLVNKLYGDILRESLTQEGFEVAVLLVEDKEEYKSLESAARLYIELFNFYADRLTPILALGGGVIGDLAGFVAATYLRGLPLIQVPTTLLAQVDSSIGGKVALNYGQIKNKIGAFYQPKLVISDVTTLRTLTAEEISDGLAEIIKYAVIRDKQFFAYLEKNIEKIKALEDKTLEEVIFRSAMIKARIVEKDERDWGLRNILNYGHTIGHAIEAASDFKVRHGQAVAIGMIAEAGISTRLGIFNENEFIRLKSLIINAGLPTEIPNLNIEKIIQAIKHDKKVIGGKIRFVLPRSIGDMFISEEVPYSVIEQVLMKC